MNKSFVEKQRTEEVTDAPCLSWCVALISSRMSFTPKKDGNIKRCLKDIVFAMLERWQLKIALFIFFVAATLVTVTYADYLVTGESWHSGFGHLIPFNWLKQWWLTTSILFFLISCLVATAYMQFREETKRHKLTAFILAFTVFWQNISGNLDLCWFIIDWLKGRLWLTWDTVWTWSPLYWHFDMNWTTKNQMAVTFIMNLYLMMAWAVYGIYLKTKQKY